MENEKDQANEIIRQLSEKAKENLRRNEELRRNASPFLSIQPGEKLSAQVWKVFCLLMEKFSNDTYR